MSGPPPACQAAPPPPPPPPPRCYAGGGPADPSRDEASQAPRRGGLRWWTSPSARGHRGAVPWLRGPRHTPHEPANGSAFSGRQQTAPTIKALPQGPSARRRRGSGTPSCLSSTASPCWAARGIRSLGESTRQPANHLLAYVALAESHRVNIQHRKLRVANHGVTDHSIVGIERLQGRKPFEATSYRIRGALGI